jgi:hypothetical protein
MTYMVLNGYDLLGVVVTLAATDSVAELALMVIPTH